MFSVKYYKGSNDREVIVLSNLLFLSESDYNI